MEQRRTSGIKQEQLDIGDKMSKSPTPGNFDFRKLYGDLSRKLLSTPVEEIFSDVISDARTKKSNRDINPENISPSLVHPAFPMYGDTPPSPLSPSGNHCEQGATLASPLTLYSSYPNPLFSIPTSDSMSPINGKHARAPVTDDDIKYHMDNFEGMENIDIQKLVDEFRVTLERYGVSQRFAARFIMQDTSQGNLSFLMEKGRNKKWAELSARGRVPYIKMKAWLESKEQQMMTLDMLKYSQDVRKSGPREPFNRRERFSMFQLNVLCRMFEENPNPPMNIRTAVAERLGIPLDRVNVWFQNQRARGFPARKNLQLQTMYETGHDSSKAFDMDVEYSQFRESLLSPVETPLVMTHISNSISSPVFPTTGSPPEVKSTHSPVLFSPTSTSFQTDLPSHDAPLDLSFPNGHEDKKRNRSGESSRDSLTSSNNEIHNEVDSYVVKTDTVPKVGAAKRKRGCVPQQIVQRKNSAVSDIKTIHPPKRVKTEVSSPDGIQYNYLLHSDDLHSINGRESGNIHQAKFTNGNSTYSPENRTAHAPPVSDTNYTEYNSPEDSILVSRENKSMLNCETSNQSAEGTLEENGVTGLPFNGKDDVKKPHTMDVFKAMCASFATKKDNSATIDVQEPELD